MIAIDKKFINLLTEINNGKVLHHPQKLTQSRKGRTDNSDIWGLINAAKSRLFSYGTLQPGASNYTVVSAFSGYWQEAYVRGFYHSHGWGLTGGYPAIKWDEKGDKINGQLLTSPTIDWNAIDNFEGPAYRRILVPVYHRDDLVIANVYVLNTID